VKDHDTFRDDSLGSLTLKASDILSLGGNENVEVVKQFRLADVPHGLLELGITLLKNESRPQVGLKTILYLLLNYCS